MEDLEQPSGSPSLQDYEEPQGNNDPRDPLNPGIEEEDRPNAPLGDPLADVDAFEDDEAPETVETMNEREDEDAMGETPGEADKESSGDESELEELDEEQFEDFDPSALEIPARPVAVDESNVGLLGVHKRKRTEEEERERKKKKKEGRREKPKKSKKKTSDGEDDNFSGGEEIEGKRSRKSKVGADGRQMKNIRRARTPPPEDEENLTPEERRRRALDKKMDEALKSHRANPRSRRHGIDLEAAADAEIESMRQRMATACSRDAEARAKGQVATHKLAILPEVVELMNRNTIQAQLVDPDINILEAVRFMLEPADHDAALPNYQIQRQLFEILGKLRIGKEALVASGIGKVVLFYTKSTQPQPEIKRQAEKLIGEWMRVVLKKRKDMRNAPIETRTYDPLASSQAPRNSLHTDADRARIAAEKRRKMLAQPQPANRARVEGGIGTYTVAPVNTLSNAQGVSGRKLGASGEDAFRKIAARGAVKAGGMGGSGGKRA